MGLNVNGSGGSKLCLIGSARRSAVVSLVLIAQLVCSWTDVRGTFEDFEAVVKALRAGDSLAWDGDSNNKFRIQSWEAFLQVAQAVRMQGDMKCCKTPLTPSTVDELKRQMGGKENEGLDENGCVFFAKPRPLDADLYMFLDPYDDDCSDCDSEWESSDGSTD